MFGLPRRKVLYTIKFTAIKFYLNIPAFNEVKVIFTDNLIESFRRSKLNFRLLHDSICNGNVMQSMLIEANIVHFGQI